MTVSETRKSARKRPSRARSGALTRQDWIDAAREVLIADGVERVKVEPLAARLSVSRGSFYWHFKDQKALLDALLDEWEESSMEPMRALAEGDALSPVARYETFMRVWVQGEPAYPVYDLAIRRWAMVSEDVAKRVRKTDRARIRLLTDIFEEMGHDPDEALIRARIAYLHQIGYYATDLNESASERDRLWPLYLKIIAGRAG